MKQLKIIFPLFFILFSTYVLQAQGKAKVPEKLHGFWYFIGAAPDEWDGTMIGADYVEFFYRLYLVDKVEELGSDGYRIWLHHDDGTTLELSISELVNQHAKLQFSQWNEPRNCEILAILPYMEPIPINKLPQALYREWSNDGKGTVFCKFHDSNQLLYENKEWEILSAGLCNKKEYRLLVRSGEQYKMLYLQIHNNKILQFTCNLTPIILSPLATNKEIYKILGNWGQKSSNSWQLGLFENFAIYKGDFWNYDLLNIKGADANIILKNGTQQVKLKLRLKSDELCEITVDGKKKNTFFKCGKNMPAYTSPDTTAFKDTRFLKTDTVTINGYLRNIPFNKPFSVAFNNPATDEQAEFFADVDSLGRFTLKFPLINTSQVFLDWGRMMKVDVVEPGETYLLFFDFVTNQHLSMGDNERLHNELSGYNIFWQSFNQEEYERKQKMAPMEFLNWEKENLRKVNQHLNEYMISNPFLSERSRYYLENYSRFEAAANLMQCRFKLDRNKSGRFPAGFMEYIDDTLYKNTPVKPVTLVREYLSFMRDYIGYSGERNVLKIASVSSDEALKYLYDSGRLKLTDNETQLMTKFKELDKISWKLYLDKADSTKRAETLKPYKDLIEMRKELYSQEVVKTFFRDEWSKIADELLAKRGLNNDLAQIDSLITDPLLKEIFEVKKFYQLLDWKKTALSPEAYQLFKKRVVIPGLAAPIEKLQDHYSQLSNQDIQYTESLKNTDHLKDSKDADALFAQLIEPYKGKVVYIDFWGTWCGPCKQQMQYVGAVKEALKGKDVIFMYFANNSPEESYKNVIKENHLTGENVVHYRLPNEQQAMIERRLSIRSYPTFILMDKTGNIVNMKASRPEEKDQLIQEITKLLN